MTLVMICKTVFSKIVKNKTKQKQKNVALKCSREAKDSSPTKCLSVGQFIQYYPTCAELQLNVTFSHFDI